MRAAIAALALVALPAHADFMSGNKLLSTLEGDESDKLYAYGYIAGVADAFNYLTFCMPDKVTVGQAADIALNHLKTYPQTRHFAADSLLGLAFGEVWPCSKKSTGKKM